MTYYNRNLPHIHPANTSIFITCRLADSIPVNLLATLRKNYEYELQETSSLHFKSPLLKTKIYNLQKKYFGKYDDLLDSRVAGPVWLKNNDVAEIVWNKIHSFNKVKYELISLSILYNHFHLVMHPHKDLKVSESNLKGKTRKYLIADILRLIKGSTSREANKILGKAGSFWHHESYDHYVRNEFELARINQYVINNPHKAGLINKNSLWKWSTLNSNFS